MQYGSHALSRAKFSLVVLHLVPHLPFCQGSAGDDAGTVLTVDASGATGDAGDCVASFFLNRVWDCWLFRGIPVKFRCWLMGDNSILTDSHFLA
ncbi:hypothetical protein KZ779_00230 [Escherichia coli]|nr:hypothetical protein [Escherichia coli]